MKHDAIYARYSSHAQDDGTSIEVQVEQCERTAGGKLMQYVDRAKTGRSSSGRPELLRLLSDAEAGKVRRLFVYKFDRLGRDAETHLIVRQLEEAGVEVISTTEGTNQLARGIQLVVAEDYSRQLATRTRDGLVKRFEQGGFTGGVAPFGYSVVERDGRRVLTVNESEAAIVRDVVHQYLCESVGFKTIARGLRARGVQSRRQNDKGKRRSLGWTFTSVRALLVNPILVGRVRFNARKMHLDRKTGRRVPKMKDAAEHLERQDESLRILDDETFERIQAQIGKRATGAPASRHGLAPLTGLVYCQCGARAHRAKSKNARGEYYYYLCSKKTRYDACEHGGPRVREDVILAQIRDRFACAFKNKKKIIAVALKVAAEAVRENRQDADRIKAQLAEAEGEQSRLVELLMDRGITAKAKDAIGRKLAEVEERRDALLAGMDGLREQATADTEGLAAVVEEIFNDARESLDKAVTPEQMNRAIDEVFGPLEIHADGTVIQRQMPPAEAGGIMHGNIAGGGFEPPTSGL
jgi:site-specific DNA recombinase